MANNVFYVKRTSTSGRTPNTTGSYATNAQYIAAGELALNMADGILYTSNGSALITVGANVVNKNVTGTLTVNSATVTGGATINNNKYLNFQTVNTAAYATFVQQSDDNFVFYTTNASYGQRAVFAIYANTNSSNLQVLVPIQPNGGLVANGSLGSAGQVLTSTGSSLYWSTVSGGGGSVNVAAQYTWTNTQTFSANISFTGNNISVVNGTGSIQFNGAGDANWRIGRATGTLTKTYYTNNTLDIIAGGSNLEGVVFGNASNTYLELGANGVYTKNQIYVGSTTTNLAITSSSITSSGATQLSITANNMTLGSANGIALYSSTGQVNAASGNLTAFGYAALGGAGGNYLVLGQQTNNFAQWIQSGYAGSPSSVYYNIILNPLGGSVGVGNTVPTAKFSVNGTTYLQGNVTFTQGIVDSTGSQGTAGQVLASNGAGNVYWTSTALNANNSSYLGGTIASGYQTTAGLSANVATLAANAATYLNGKTEPNLNVNSALTANSASYLGSTAAASFVQNTDSRTLSGNLNFTGANSYFSGPTTHAANVIITSTSGVSANGSYGTSGQVLTSNGSAVYWAAASASFTNGSSISVNNFVLTGAFSANSSNGSAGQLLTSTGSGGAYWANGSTITVYYANGATAITGSGAIANSTTAASFSFNYNTFTGNGSVNTYTLNAATTTNNSLVMINGVVQQPSNAYSITGSTLTFTANVPNNAIITAVVPTYSTVAGTVSQFRNYTFIASNNQTTFTGNDSTSKLLTYDINFISVYLNGVKLAPADYTASTGNSVILTSAASNNDVLEVVSYAGLYIMNNAVYVDNSVTTSNTSTWNVDTFSATSYRSASYFAQVTDNTNSNYHVQNINLVHNGSAVWITEYGAVYSNGSSLATFDATISGSNVYLTVAPVTANSTIRVLRTAVSV